MTWDVVLPQGGIESRLDLSKYLPIAGDQKKQASCTAWTMGYALMSYISDLAKDLRADRTVESGLQDVFSPGFLFNRAKQ